MANEARDDVLAIRRRLTDPARIASMLGLKSKRSSRGVVVSCPWHEDRNPSCDIWVASDRTIAVHCHSCGAGGDVLTLIKQVKGFSWFQEALQWAADVAGVALEPRDRKPAPRPNLRLLPGAAPIAEKVSAGRTCKHETEVEDVSEHEPTYPPPDELSALWAAARPISEAPDAQLMFVRRKIDPSRLLSDDACRVLRPDEPCPKWACAQGRTWSEGYPIVLPAWDHTGVMRSLRGWSVDTSAKPKRLAATGVSSQGLALANGQALAILRGKANFPQTIMIAEGEPDYLVCSQHYHMPVLGIWSGSVTKNLIDALPCGSMVVVRVDADKAGERYAAQIAELAGRRLTVVR